MLVSTRSAYPVEKAIASKSAAGVAFKDVARRGLSKIAEPPAR
ncbi:hypothetical protein CKA32_004902 [Geitlerinema sp. FC II]|nr:hypothetical protein CKA32_004903 [Geitlerinema sp. FC II]PPT07580.1 hypothetical protein CKA32_004902 [Geitlerinema sp. FC II]